MVIWIVVMKIQQSICLDDSGKPRKNPSQVSRYRELNRGPPECESRPLPRSHLARWVYFIALGRDRVASPTLGHYHAATSLDGSIL